MTEKISLILQEYEIYELLMLFLVCSIVGWLLEMLRSVVAGCGYVRAGICAGPWCGIYGLGALLVLAADVSFGGNPVAVFAYGLVIGTVLQVVNMTVFRLASKGRRKIRFRWHNPLLWGACAVILIFHVNPLLQALIERTHPFILMAMLLLFWSLYPSQVMDGLTALGETETVTKQNHME